MRMNVNWVYNVYCKEIGRIIQSNRYCLCKCIKRIRERSVKHLPKSSGYSTYYYYTESYTSDLKLEQIVRLCLLLSIIVVCQSSLLLPK